MTTNRLRVLQFEQLEARSMLATLDLTGVEFRTPGHP